MAEKQQEAARVSCELRRSAVKLCATCVNYHGCYYQFSMSAEHYNSIVSKHASFFNEIFQVGSEVRIILKKKTFSYHLDIGRGLLYGARLNPCGYY